MSAPLVILAGLPPLVGMWWVLTGTQFWSIAGWPVVILATLVTLGVMSNRIYSLYRELQGMTTIFILLLSLLHISGIYPSVIIPATKLALFDIASVIWWCIFVNAIGSGISKLDLITRALTGEVDFSVQHPREFMVKFRLGVTLVGLYYSAICYCFFCQQWVGPTDTLLPSGSALGWAVCIRMMLTVTIPLVQIYPLLKYIGSTWLMLPLILISAYMLVDGVALVIILALSR